MTEPALDDIRDDIGTLEQRIEALSDSLERCRKIALAAKAAIGAGVALLAALLLGFVMPDALPLMLASILTLGGIVLAGSNASTARETAARIAQAERQRSALIGELDLTLAPEPSRLLH